MDIGNRARSEAEGVPRERRERRRRRATLHAILACAIAGPFVAPALHAAHGFKLPPARDLAADAASSARSQTPILLFFDREDCPYCERALREYLVPMSRDEVSQGKALYRQVEVDRPLPLVDFEGRATTHGALAARYAITLTPTILMVDAAGTPLGAPLVGLSPDFYAAYLDNLVESATKRLRR